VAIGSGGVLYGTTFGGGAATSGEQCLDGGCGTVFSLTPPASQGGSWTQTVLHSFSGYPSDGSEPEGALTIGSGGVLYGTTLQGGSLGWGTVFSLTPPPAPGRSWTYTLIYDFAATSGGSGELSPSGSLVIAEGGALFGTTQYGGEINGAVFSLTPPTSPDGSWAEAVVYSFKGFPRDGASPTAGLVKGDGGLLYGTTYSGGTWNHGTVFSLTPSGSPGASWTDTVLYSFCGRLQSTGGCDRRRRSAIRHHLLRWHGPMCH
jgi:uncharacterized repeat protein (TIGR03803 family)